MVKNWIQAFRLRTLPLSVSGILVGSAIAYRNDTFNIVLFILGILTVLFLQILSNLANDLGDNLKGTDNENRIGPVRSTQTGAINRVQMKRAIYLFTFLSLASGGILAYLGTRGMSINMQLTFYALAVACILAAIGYTIGKNAYAYLGLGDVFVFLFFGLLSVCGIYVLMAKSFDFTVLLPAVSIGFLSVGVLNLNNMRDHENDAQCGKNTLVVKIGFANALKYHFALILSPIMLTVLYAAINNLWISTIALLTYFILLKHVVFVVKNPEPKKLDGELGKVAISTFLYALLFSLSCFLA